MTPEVIRKLLIEKIEALPLDRAELEIQEVTINYTRDANKFYSKIVFHHGGHRCFFINEVQELPAP